MSAFNCSKEHYQYLADGLLILIKNSSYKYAFFELDINPHQLSEQPHAEKNAVDCLIVELQTLNAQAVAARYKETPYIHEQVKAKLNDEINILQLFKALQCTMYQCSESPTDENKIYKQWHNFVNRIAGIIVSKLPEYDRAEWEIHKEVKSELVKIT